MQSVPILISHGYVQIDVRPRIRGAGRKRALKPAREDSFVRLKRRARLLN